MTKGIVKTTNILLQCMLLYMYAQHCSYVDKFLLNKSYLAIAFRAFHVILNSFAWFLG